MSLFSSFKSSAYPKLWKFNGGIHPEQHKIESRLKPITKALIPGKLSLPLHQHIGNPAEPVVKIGDKVLKGQMIARASGFVSAPVHAPTSGTVTDIDDFPLPHPSGLTAPCIILRTDGLDKWVTLEPVEDFEEIDPSELRNIIRTAGIVGLGGAGFPSFIKLNPGPGKVIDTLLINGVECEPYITCDDLLMTERPHEIISGIKIIKHALKANQCIVAIEDNKPEAYHQLRSLVTKNDNISIIKVPTLYPQGSEKQLVKVVTGKEVPRDGLSSQVGVVGHNIGTTVAVHRAIRHGEPLLSRVMTITGSGVAHPCNKEVLLGTSMADLIAECGGDPGTIKKLIMGGPMMGFSLHQTHLPVIKTTNCIIASSSDELTLTKREMPCIRCGACADACPVNLLPQQIFWHAKAKELDKAQEYNLFDCIECGCCSYVCPSHIPLVHYYRFAKGEIWIQEREKEKSDIARDRHEFRLERIENEKLARKLKRKKKTTPSTTGKTKEDSKKAEIAAAVKRVREKSQQANSDDTLSDKLKTNDTKTDHSD